MSLSRPSVVQRTVGIVSVCGLLGFSTLFPAQAKHEDEESLTEPAVPEIADAKPRLSVPEYQSPISSYLSFEDAEPRDWKEANDRVGKLGGWLFYTREAFRAEKAEKEKEKEKEKEAGKDKETE